MIVIGILCLVCAMVCVYLGGVCNAKKDETDGIIAFGILLLIVGIVTLRGVGFTEDKLLQPEVRITITNGVPDTTYRYQPTWSQPAK